MYRIFAVSSYFVGYESTEGWGTIKRANLSVKLRCPATLLPKGSMTLLCVTNAVQGLNMKGWTRLLRSYTLFCGQGEMISLKQKTFDLALQRKGYKAQCLKISEKSHTTLRAKRATLTFRVAKKWPKIDRKCLEWKIQMRHFGLFSNTVLELYFATDKSISSQFLYKTWCANKNRDA